MKFGRREGDSTPCIGVGGVEFGGLVEGSHSLSEVLLTNQILPMGDEQIDVIGRFGQQRHVELVRSLEFAGLGENVGKHAGDRRVQGMGGVEFLEQRQGIRIVLCGKHRGELRVQGRVVGALLERSADELFSFGKVFAPR